jgi:hypothetical protein
MDDDRLEGESVSPGPQARGSPRFGWLQPQPKLLQIMCMDTQRLYVDYVAKMLETTKREHGPAAVGDY